MSNTSSSISCSLPDYAAFYALLREHEVALTPAEMHGLITGLIVGNLQNRSWTSVLYEMTNEGIAYPNVLAQQVIQLYDATRKLLEGGEYTFELYLPDDITDIDNDASVTPDVSHEQVNLYERIEALSGWVNHFLLGLGLTQNNLSQLPNDEAELLADLRDIAKLGFDEEDTAMELEDALVEVSEYVRMAAIIFFDLFGHTDDNNQNAQNAHNQTSMSSTIPTPQNIKPTLH